MPAHDDPLSEHSFVMRVPEGGAALQFFTEAMKANTETLKQVSMTMRGIQEEQKATLSIVHDTRERIIRLESTRTDGDVAKLEKIAKDNQERIKRLEDAHLIREATTGAGVWLLKNIPSLATIFLGLIIIALAVLKVTGRLP